MSEYLIFQILRILDGLFVSFILFVLCWHYELQVFSKIFTLLICFSFFFSILCMTSANIYRSFRFTSLKVEIYNMCNGFFLLFAGLAFSIYFTGLEPFFSRNMFVLWMISWGVSVILLRVFIRYLLRSLRKRGYCQKKVVIAGRNSAGKELVDQFFKHSWTGVEVMGFFDDFESDDYRSIKVLGKISELRCFVEKEQIDFVYITLPVSDLEKWRKIVNDLSYTSASVNILPDIFLFDLFIQGSALYFDNLPFVNIRFYPISGIAGFIKNCFDRIVALMLLVLLSPLFFILAYMVKSSSPGPIIYKQQRHGITGETIVVYKFRTMYHCDNGDNFRQVCKNDPGVTTIGTFLRKTSLDELPQLWNVLKGNMSLVGPRPHPVAMNAKYDRFIPDYMRRHKVKPGITGFAQVNGCRGETDSHDKIVQRIQYDLQYIREWTVMMDIEILIKTIFVLNGQKNAY